MARKSTFKLWLDLDECLKKITLAVKEGEDITGLIEESLFLSNDIDKLPWEEKKKIMKRLYNKATYDYLILGKALGESDNHNAMEYFAREFLGIIELPYPLPFWLLDYGQDINFDCYS